MGTIPNSYNRAVLIPKNDVTTKGTYYHSMAKALIEEIDDETDISFKNGVVTDYEDYWDIRLDLDSKTPSLAMVVVELDAYYNQMKACRLKVQSDGTLSYEETKEQVFDDGDSKVVPKSISEHLARSFTKKINSSIATDLQAKGLLDSKSRRTNRDFALALLVHQVQDELTLLANIEQGSNKAPATALLKRYLELLNPLNAQHKIVLDKLYKFDIPMIKQLVKEKLATAFTIDSADSFSPELKTQYELRQFHQNLKDDSLNLKNGSLDPGKLPPTLVSSYGLSTELTTHSSSSQDFVIAVANKFKKIQDATRTNQFTDYNSAKEYLLEYLEFKMAEKAKELSSSLLAYCDSFDANPNDGKFATDIEAFGNPKDMITTFYPEAFASELILMNIEFNSDKAETANIQTPQTAIIATQKQEAEAKIDALNTSGGSKSNNSGTAAVHRRDSAEPKEIATMIRHHATESQKLKLTQHAEALASGRMDEFQLQEFVELLAVYSTKPKREIHAKLATQLKLIDMQTVYDTVQIKDLGLDEAKYKARNKLFKAFDNAYKKLSPEDKAKADVFLYLRPADLLSMKPQVLGENIGEKITALGALGLDLNQMITDAGVDATDAIEAATDLLLTFSAVQEQGQSALAVSEFDSGLVVAQTSGSGADFSAYYIADVNSLGEEQLYSDFFTRPQDFALEAHEAPYYKDLLDAERQISLATIITIAKANEKALRQVLQTLNQDNLSEVAGQFRHELFKLDTVESDMRVFFEQDVDGKLVTMPLPSYKHGLATFFTGLAGEYDEEKPLVEVPPDLQKLMQALGITVAKQQETIIKYLRAKGTGDERRWVFDNVSANSLSKDLGKQILEIIMAYNEQLILDPRDRSQNFLEIEDKFEQLKPILDASENLTYKPRAIPVSKSSLEGTLHRFGRNNARYQQAAPRIRKRIGTDRGPGSISYKVHNRR